MLIFPLEKERDGDEKKIFIVCQDFVFMGQKNTKCETDSVDKSNFWPHKDKRKNLTDKIQEPGSVNNDDTLKGFISSHAP